MNINPEFRRNLWLELTPSRLVGMPLVLGIFLLLAYLIDGRQYGGTVARTASFLFSILVILWGTRLSCEALVVEIREHTWDNQRLSVISPWSMTWGKLLGSTIFTWYGGLLCLLVYLTSRPEPPLSLPETILLMVGSGLFGQAVGLLASLQSIRKNQRHGRFQTTAFWALGAGGGLFALKWPFATSNGIWWYGRYFPDDQFVLASLLLFLTWAVFGIYRLIRAELQLPTLPWAWILFTLFLAGYVAGFPELVRWQAGQGVWQQRLASGFLIILGLTYGTAFFERKDPVSFRRLLQHIRHHEWLRALASAPLWLITLPLAVLSCFLLVACADQIPSPLAVSAVAMTFFLFRDIGILLFLNLGRIPKRADMLAALWLTLLYGIIPWILASLDLASWTGLFLPRPSENALIQLPVALSQAAVVLCLVILRWRRGYRYT